MRSELTYLLSCKLEAWQSSGLQLGSNPEVVLRTPVMTSLVIENVLISTKLLHGHFTQSYGLCCSRHPLDREDQTWLLTLYSATAAFCNSCFNLCVYNNNNNGLHVVCEYKYFSVIWETAHYSWLIVFIVMKCCTAVDSVQIASRTLVFIWHITGFVVNKWQTTCWPHKLCGVSWSHIRGRV